jgi:hypothetical protein
MTDVIIGPDDIDARSASDVNLDAAWLFSRIEG